MPREYQFWEDDLEGLPKVGEDWRLYQRQMDAAPSPQPRIAAAPMEEPEPNLPTIERFGDTPDKPPKIAYTWRPDPEDGLAAGRIEADEPDPILASMRSLRERRQEHAAARPSIHDRDLQPSRLQKILNIVGNAAVGYVNAGGRTRPIAPIPLSRGKYEQAMDRWENEGNTLEEEARAAMGEYTLRRQSDADARADRESTARMKETEAQTAERLARARHYDQPARQPIMSSPGGLYDPNKDRIIPGTKPADKPGRRYAEDVYMNPESTEADRKRALEWRQQNKKPGGGPSAEITASERSDIRMREHANRQELAALEKEEYGDPQMQRPGLHELRVELGQTMTATDAEKGDSSKVRSDLARVNNRLRMIYKRKLELRAITRAEHDQMVAGLQDAAPSRVPAPAAPPPTPASKPPQSRRPLSSFDRT